MVACLHSNFRTPAMTLRHHLIAALFFALPAAQAATLVEIKAGGEITKIYYEGSMSRLETPGNRGYMVIDSARQTMHMVIPEQRMVMDMSDTLKNAPGDATDSGIRIDISKQGSGPRVAGYKTTRYSHSANNKNCGTLLTSQEAMEDTGMGEVLEMMERMSAQADAMISAFNRNADPCQRSSMQLTKRLKDIGVPLRVLDAGGAVVSEVIRIDRKAKLPANAFTVPSDYQVQNTHKMMQDARQQMQKMPDIQEMMKQMQQQRAQ
ncbi:MAG: hypothetical protein BMS9Abin06_0868 [Gammaproteobacteria bacterium]|nr:MAG: hypothetical protein BMS9Abin06_0868 [Gammaproteobacteria bacterium]